MSRPEWLAPTVSPTRGRQILLFHSTSVDNANMIRQSGFVDSELPIGTLDDGTPYTLRGVWFSDRPTWDGGYCDVLPEGWCSLVIDIPEAVAAEHRLEYDDPTDIPYAEWCIPAPVAGRYLIRDEGV
jgi:hypothetical protein